MPLVKPIIRVRWPEDLLDQRNGFLDPELLAGSGIYNGYDHARQMPLHHTAARSSRALAAAARAAGFKVFASGTLRTFDEQCQIFDGVTYPYNHTTRTGGRYLPSTHWASHSTSYWAFPYDQRQWKGLLWRRIHDTASAAIPGDSNHGWGLAIDFSLELDDNPRTAESVTVAFTFWLIENAATYGFSAEIQSEDWHWRYVAGDVIPYATLRFEAGARPPTPVPKPKPGQGPTPIPQEGDDMPMATVHISVRDSYAEFWTQAPLITLPDKTVVPDVLWVIHSGPNSARYDRFKHNHGENPVIEFATTKDVIAENWFLIGDPALIEDALHPNGWWDASMFYGVR